MPAAVCAHRLTQGDTLTLSDVFAGMENGKITLTDETTGDQIALVADLTARQRAILKAGGLLGYTKEQGK